ncbi:MAG: hypothetical protein LC803_06765 [Acidobacteria bacterium]|nr:hypothetical protein [Acidobacteriota bacterium]
MNDELTAEDFSFRSSFIIHRSSFIVSFQAKEQRTWGGRSRPRRVGLGATELMARLVGLCG